MIFRHRSEEPEIIDDFSLGGEEIERSLKSIEGVNRWLGGHRILVDSLATVLARPEFQGRKSPFVIYDLGCGSGDGLRALAAWGRKEETGLRLTGLDANPFVLDYARSQSGSYEEIDFELRNILDPGLPLSDVDIVTLNLCLHHFTDDEIRVLLGRCREAGVRAVLINDLHRHWLAYALFQLVCLGFRSPRIAREDGLLSIRKGFRRPELERLAVDVGARKHELRWRWAFRFQLLLFFD